MPQVRFTHDPKLPNDWKNKPYKKDWVGNMTQDEADRWMRRGVLEIISENKAVIHATGLAAGASQSSDDKVKLQQRAEQLENEAKAKVEAEEEAAKVKASHAAVAASTQAAARR